VKISSFSKQDVSRRLKYKGLCFQIGPFVINVSSPISAVLDNIYSLYSDYEIENDGFADFHIAIEKSSGLRAFWRPQANFVFDGFVPFKPLPFEQSFALFEWGLNWCIASYAHQYLILHSAVVEKNGVAVILPGSPGAGKSTLCTTLVNSEWRLFSDEMALICPNSLEVVPIPRPISLKNESIEIIANRFPDVEFGLLADDTHKGRITHVKPPVESLQRSNESAKVKWIIFPKYKNNSPLVVDPMHKADAFMKTAEQGFNYQILGEQGFDTLAALIDTVETYSLEYSNLDDAITYFEQLSVQDKK